MNTSFQGLVEHIAKFTLSNKSLQSVEELKSQPSISQMVTDTIGSINENIQIRRFARLQAAAGEPPKTAGILGYYMHNTAKGNLNLAKIGCLVSLQIKTANDAAASIARNPETIDLAQKI